ncbi:hypothetical protein QYM36_019764 [Artemia franciscana]|uniref:Uncharacterized protein n=1 Tax=Artemia franciscana TaxID=6661 RepID=A0AA88KTK5_ARTSF|nr:hypothetical protein QYM36_019764 [Artemia franciscana]
MCVLVDPEQLTSKELADPQQQDFTLTKCFTLASSGQSFELINCLLYRNIETKLDKEEITQLVVPKPCRSFVLRVAHDSPMSGHTVHALWIRSSIGSSGLGYVKMSNGLYVLVILAS